MILWTNSLKASSERYRLRRNQYELTVAIGLSDYAAVQLSDTLKVRASVLSRSVDSDVAVLRVNPQHLTGITPVTLAYAENGRAPAVEGQQVFTIGSPLNQRKAMTSGIVSKIEDK